MSLSFVYILITAAGAIVLVIRLHRRRPTLKGIRMSFSFTSPQNVGDTLVITTTGIGSDGKPFPLPAPVAYTVAPDGLVTLAPHADGFSTVATWVAAGTATFTATEPLPDGTALTDTGTASAVAPPPPPPPTLKSIVMTASPVAGPVPGVAPA